MTWNFFLFLLNVKGQVTAMLFLICKALIAALKTHPNFVVIREAFKETIKICSNSKLDSVKLHVRIGVAFSKLLKEIS